MTLPSKYGGPYNTRRRIGIVATRLIIFGVISVPCLVLSFNKINNDLAGTAWTIQHVAVAIGLGFAIPVVLGTYWFLCEKFRLPRTNLWKYVDWPKEKKTDESG